MPTWDETMATGVDEIDGDHRTIAGLFDEILHVLAEEREHEVIIAAVSRLVDIMCEHFEHEDDQMRSIGYRDAATHRIEHDAYLGRLSQLLVDCQRHSKCIADNIRELSTLWKFQHQDRFDRPLARAVLDAGAASPALMPEFSRRSVCR